MLQFLPFPSECGTHMLMFLETLLCAGGYAKDFIESCHLAPQQDYESVLLLSQIRDKEIQA